MKIFFSYSWNDQPLASRIYEKLNSKREVVVWRDQVNGEPAIDIQKRIENEINQSDYFLLLDTSNSRRSNWVKYEISTFLKSKNKSRLLPCLGDTVTTVHKVTELFPNQNNLLYFDFSEMGKYDEKQKFLLSIRKLFRYINVSEPGKEDLPSVKDFEHELQILRLDDRKRDFFTREFYLIWEYQDLINVEQRLKLLIEELAINDYLALIPYLSLAVFYNEGQSFEESLEILGDKFDKRLDPRVHSIKSTAYFNLGHYKLSLKFLKKADKLVKKLNNVNFNRMRQDINWRYGQIFFKLNNYKKAKGFLETEFKQREISSNLKPSNFTELAFLFYSNNRYEVAMNLLHKAENIFPKEPEVLIELARIHARIKNYKTSKSYFLKSLDLDSTNLITYYELYQVLLNMENGKELEDIYSRIKMIQPKTREEYYYKGALFYQNNEYCEAQKHYYESGSFHDYYSTILNTIR